jgi:ribonuclease Z
LRSGIGFRRLNRILITHGHLDHILGLAGLLSTFSRWETIDELQISAGAWALDRIHDLLYGVVLRNTSPSIKIDLVALEPGSLFESNNLTVSAFPVMHRGPGCFGFLFEEPSRRPFLAEKAEQLNIPAGPLRGELVDGKSITLADGRTISPDEVLGPVRHGTRLVHVGDCASTENLKEVCQNADSLVIEATYLDVESDLAKKFGHLTAKQAASLAAESNVGQLFLTHISRRYRESQVLEEAKAIFPNVIVARDFDRYHVRRGLVNEQI